MREDDERGLGLAHVPEEALDLVLGECPGNAGREIEDPEALPVDIAHLEVVAAGDHHVAFLVERQPDGVGNPVERFSVLLADQLRVGREPPAERPRDRPRYLLAEVLRPDGDIDAVLCLIEVRYEREAVAGLLERLLGLLRDIRGDLPLVGVDLPAGRPHLDVPRVVTPGDAAAPVAGLLLPADLGAASSPDRDAIESRLHLDGAGRPVRRYLFGPDGYPDILRVLVDLRCRYRQFGDEVNVGHLQVRPGLAAFLRLADRTVDGGHVRLAGQQPHIRRPALRAEPLLARLPAARADTRLDGHGSDPEYLGVRDVADHDAVVF